MEKGLKGFLGFVLGLGKEKKRFFGVSFRLGKGILLSSFSKTSNLCGVIGVENGIPEQGSHSTDKKSVGKRECCVILCDGGNVYV